MKWQSHYAAEHRAARDRIAGRTAALQPTMLAAPAGSLVAPGPAQEPSVSLTPNAAALPFDVEELRKAFGNRMDGPWVAGRAFDGADEVARNDPAHAEARREYEMAMEEIDVAMLEGTANDEFAQAAEAAVWAEHAARQAAVLAKFSARFCATLAKAATDGRYKDRIAEVASELSSRFDQICAIEKELGATAEPTVNKQSRGSEKNRLLTNPTEACKHCGTPISTRRRAMTNHLKVCKRKPVIVGIEPGVYIMALDQS